MQKLTLKRMKRKERIDLRNRNGPAIFATEKDNQKKLKAKADAERDTLKPDLMILKKAQESDNLEEMKANLKPWTKSKRGC